MLPSQKKKKKKKKPKINLQKLRLLNTLKFKIFKQPHKQHVWHLLKPILIFSLQAQPKQGHQTCYFAKALSPTLSLQTCYFVSNYIFNSNQLVSFLIFCMDCNFRVYFPIKGFKWLKKEKIFYYLGFVFVNENVLHIIVLITINIDNF